jgi:hypothetical protein
MIKDRGGGGASSLSPADDGTARRKGSALHYSRPPLGGLLFLSKFRSVTTSMRAPAVWTVITDVYKLTNAKRLGLSRFELEYVKRHTVVLAHNHDDTARRGTLYREQIIQARLKPALTNSIVSPHL